MKSEDIAAYLINNPDFFNQNKEVLAKLEFGESQPFHQRQLEVLRDRHDAEKTRYQLVVESARNNQLLEQDLHQLGCDLLSCLAGSEPVDGRLILDKVCNQFKVDQGRIYLADQLHGITADDFDLLGKRVAHGSSICDDRVSSGLLDRMFGANSGISSCAFLPLSTNANTPGVLVLGSLDKARFQPGMGALILDRIGQLVGASLGL